MSRKILIFNAGNARIITEAIWGLKKTKNWVPDEIHIFTTDKTDIECRKAFVTPAGSSVNRLTEVCRVLGVPEPSLQLHLASGVCGDGEDSQAQPIHLLKEPWETEALNSLYDQALVPLLVDEQTEVVCLSRSGLSEMQLLMSYYVVALMCSDRHYWYSVHIRVLDSDQADAQEDLLQRDKNFWYPKDIKLGDVELSASQICIDLKVWDYSAMKRTVSERQFRNPGTVQQILIDAKNKTLTLRANTVMQANMGSFTSVFILQALANMYGLRAEPYSQLSARKELAEAFFEHIEQIKRGADGPRLLPYNDYNLFEPSLRDLIIKRLAPQIMAYCHNGQSSVQEESPMSFTLEFDEVEQVIAHYFYTESGNFVQNCTYWWRNVAAFQWKWEKRLIAPLASGRVKEPNRLTFSASAYAQRDKFVNRNFKSQEKIAKYIATNIFNLTLTGTYSIDADRSNINTRVKEALPEGDWINQLQWDSRGRLPVEAESIKFTDADYLKEALENLLADPNTRFEKCKIRDALKNIDRYIAKPVPGA